MDDTSTANPGRNRGYSRPAASGRLPLVTTDIGFLVTG